MDAQNAQVNPGNTPFYGIMLLDLAHVLDTLPLLGGLPVVNPNPNNQNNPGTTCGTHPYSIISDNNLSFTAIVASDISTVHAAPNPNINVINGLPAGLSSIPPVGDLEPVFGGPGG
ncbi:hypothetical protein FRC17_003319 [Serendipita sp. 399]|nr:hypothetical protein FRC17_003319 [Serendipita sp. 399]